MQTIIYCPICGDNIRFRETCSGCGYVPARDYQVYPTLGQIPGDTVSIKVKRQEWEKQRIREIVDEILHTRDVQVEEKSLPYSGAEIISLPQPNKALINISDNSCTFGSYPQDANGTVSPILWDVLEVDQESHKVLLISKYVLDCQKYNTIRKDVTWETCSLREWLNSTFLRTAFIDEEQSIIQEVTVSADRNPNYNTNQGRITRDKVFLLSIFEVMRYFSESENRMCAPTAYAVEQGVWTSDSFKLDGRATCYWWSRSVGASDSVAALVCSDGIVNATGGYVNGAYVGVRPALWVNLESVIW